MHSPFQSRALEQALMHWQEGDQLLLLQDGVLAACAPQWLA
ncbi:MAG: DsrH/TusB family sulfur metabolism protein, partial [Shewanella sp.]